MLLDGGVAVLELGDSAVGPSAMPDQVEGWAQGSGEDRDVGQTGKEYVALLCARMFATSQSELI